MPSAIAAATLRPASHDSRMSAVDHLEELRARLFVCLAVLAIAFGFCFWQNHELLHIINHPLSKTTTQQTRDGRGTTGANYKLQRNARDVARQLQTVTSVLAQESHNAADIAALDQVGANLTHEVKALSAAPTGAQPVTLGIAEPFTATLTVTLLFALILSLPVLLLQAYGFLVPALTPDQKRHMVPIVCAIPGLFAAGVVFGYVVVLPSALHFFEGFNSGQFNVLIQASQYYKFAAEILLAMGLLFQIPVAIVAAVRAGVITPRQLRHNRRWAILACAVAAALIPGGPISVILEMVPLYLLFEGSVIVATVSQRRADRRAASRAAQEADVPPENPLARL